ncbi:MAG: Flp pilus assembly complex ATPase component TadA [Elusimicrobia bacterium]|nr:Flp pilus assembly complex ATPase component TadA [Elusimicrobiota bacterium]
MVASGIHRKRDIKEILVANNILTEDKYKIFDEAAKKAGKHIQQILIEEKVISELKLLKILADEWGFKAVDLSKLKVTKEIVRLIPEAISRRQVCVPFSKQKNTLFVAMADPRDFLIVEDIGLRTGLEVKVYLSLAPWIHNSIQEVYGKSGTEAMNKLLKSVTDSKGKKPDDGIQLAEEKKSDIADVDASAPEVEKIVNVIILGALSTKASDIHIEPFEDPAGINSQLLVRYRIDGVLKKSSFIVPWSYRTAIVAKIKILTNSMNITERRIPQSGRIQIMAQGDPIEFRVEMVPTVYGESCVMRILDRKAVQVDITQLAFLDDTLETFLGLLSGIGGKKNFGLVIVCGPTGSGKSTTLYAALNHINRPDIKILTAENPVEFNLDGIVQVPVNPDIKLGNDKKFDFSLALRSFLRLDPDVIMVGEMRDSETAMIGMEAAMTGHLVFSTIHTNDAPSSVSRLIEMGLPSYLVVSTLKAVLAQRLARRICKKCKKERDPFPEEVVLFREHQTEIPPGTKFFSPIGCEECNKTGYKGRVGIHELLIMSPEFKKFALTEYAAGPLTEKARELGMRTIIQDGLQKIIMGLTTAAEVLGGGEVVDKIDE